MLSKMTDTTSSIPPCPTLSSLCCKPRCSGFYTYCWTELDGLPTCIYTKGFYDPTARVEGLLPRNAKSVPQTASNPLTDFGNQYKRVLGGTGSVSFVSYAQPHCTCMCTPRPLGMYRYISSYMTMVLTYSTLEFLLNTRYHGQLNLQVSDINGLLIIPSGTCTSMLMCIPLLYCVGWCGCIGPTFLNNVLYSPNLCFQSRATCNPMPYN